MGASIAKKHTSSVAAPIHPHPSEHTRLYGHAEAINTFKSYGNAMPNGIMLYGDRGIGKATLAYRIIREFLRASDPNDMADPVCMKIRAGSCADLYVLEPKQEKSAKTATITVKAVRAAGEFMQFTSSDSGRKCILIDALDDMNANAQNALLKMLEEPLGDTVMLLIAHHAGAVLPTIRSRCRALYIAPPSESDALRILQGLFPEESEDQLMQACYAAEGSPGRAADFLHSGAMKQCDYADDVILAAARGDRSIVEQGIERMQLSASNDDMWRHIVFILLRKLSDAAAERHPTLRISPEKAEYYYDRLCRWVTATDRIYLDRKTALLNVFR